MAFSVNTNIASLQAQNYLRTSSEFQSKTINRVTSGLRIVSSGDDAAGLAIANGFRSDQAVLTQGIRNANDGLSTLQTIDGGMNNISQLLDRARTLATQSASGTFAGGVSGRAQLNSEFQSVLTEIDRQATSIGLDSTGEFAKSLSVFIGGGKGASSQSVISNGSVSVDLSTSAVDTKSLGLTGYNYKTAVVAGSFYTTYGGASGGTAALSFKGAGFSSGVTVNVNLNGVGDIDSLVTAINAGITAATQGGTPAAAAFKAANITASANSDGSINLTSSSNAFMVNDSGAANGQQLLSGASAAVYGYAQGTYRNNLTGVAWTALTTTGDTQILTFQSESNGNVAKLDVTLDFDAGVTSAATAAAKINTDLQAQSDASLKKIVAVVDGAGTIGFTSTDGFNVTFATSTVARGFVGAQEGTTVAAGTVGSDTTASVAIDTISGASAAVTALANAVSALGDAQAVVGKGQNNFNYAITLAQSQVTNMAAAESRIRDADLAAEAANLSKAQILVQAGTAALAQANSAPQAILSLLRG